MYLLLIGMHSLSRIQAWYLQGNCKPFLSVVGV